MVFTEVRIYSWWEGSERKVLFKVTLLVSRSSKARTPKTFKKGFLLFLILFFCAWVWTVASSWMSSNSILLTYCRCCFLHPFGLHSLVLSFFLPLSISPTFFLLKQLCSFQWSFPFFQEIQDGICMIIMLIKKILVMVLRLHCSCCISLNSLGLLW